tara:strand:- start:264 stop:2291 length:2028 start_codon:yes stop_codon:yes gene_type:complete
MKKMKKIFFILFILIISHSSIFSQSNIKTISLVEDPRLDLNIKYNRSFDNYIIEALGNVISLIDDAGWNQKFNATSWNSIMAAAKEQGMQEMMDEVTAGRATDKMGELITSDYVLRRVVVATDRTGDRINQFEVTLILLDVSTGREQRRTEYIDVEGRTASEQKKSIVSGLTSQIANLFMDQFRREAVLNINSLDDRAVVPIVENRELPGKHDRAITAFLKAKIADDSITVSDIKFEINDYPQNGNITISNGNKLIYRPIKGFKGIDIATYFASYEDNGFPIRSEIKTITFKVTNDPPLAKSGQINLSQDNDKTFVLEGYDNDGDKLSFEITEQPLRGNIFKDNRVPGQFTYSPSRSVTGSDSFKFRAFDGVDYSSEVVFKISISRVNNLPIARSFQVKLLHDIEYEDFFRGEDSDGDKLSYIVTKEPANGKITSNDNNKFIYTPNRGFVGKDSFNYRAIDENASRSNEATVLIEVTNKKPIAINRTYQGPEEGTFTINLEGKDEDIVDDSRLSVKVYKQPFGSLEKVPGTKNEYLYTNTKNMKEDDIIFYVFDGVDNSDYARITLLLNQKNSSQVIPNKTRNNNQASVTSSGSKTVKPKPEPKPKIKSQPQSIKPNSAPKVEQAATNTSDDEGGMSMGVILGVLLLLVLLGASGGGGGGGSDPTGGVDIGITIP